MWTFLPPAWQNHPAEALARTTKATGAYSRWCSAIISSTTPRGTSVCQGSSLSVGSTTVTDLAVCARPEGPWPARPSRPEAQRGGIAPSQLQDYAATTAVQTPHTETDPLNLDAAGTAAITVQGVAALEQAVLTASQLEGIVLRYGWLYGPGTGTTVAAGSPPLHVNAAALAAALAIDRGAPGIYNIAEPSQSVAVEKARRELGWDPSFRVQDGPASRNG